MKFISICAHLFAPILFFTVSMSASAAKPEFIIVVKETSAASVSDEGNRLVFYPSQVVRVIRRKETRVLVEREEAEYPRCIDPVPPGLGKGKAWIPLQNLAELSAFEPLSEWHGPKRYAYWTDSGDSGANFYFHLDATYSAEVWSSDTKTLKLRGRLYSYGPVIWVRETTSTDFTRQSFFWRMKNGSLCYID